jgi:hypothetical protein
MIELLIEVWEDDLGQQMGAVKEFNDVRRSPSSRTVHSFRARSFREAQYLYDVGSEIDATWPEDAFDEPYTDEERRVQDEYLSRRQERK